MAKRERKPKPRPVGRPSLGEDAATETVRLRVTAAVRDQWMAAAIRSKLTLSEWLREAAELAITRGSTR